MSWTKLSIRFFGWALIVFLIYSASVLLDGLAAYVLTNLDGSRARSIELLRTCEEDEGQQLAALKAGYLSLVYPNLFSLDPSYMELADKYKIAPLGSVPRVDVYYCNEGYGTVMYRTDRLGFRNDDAIYDNEKIIGLLIGDSFVHGACVSSKETISSRLIDRGYQTLNLGTGSNGPLHYAAIAKTFIPKFKPKFATIVFYPNDNLENSESDPYFKYFFQKQEDYFYKSDSKQLELSNRLKLLYVDILDRVSVFSEQKKSKLSNGTICKQSAEKESQYHYTTSLKFSTIRSLVRGFFSKGSERQEVLPFSSKLAIDTLKESCNNYGCSPEVVYIPNSSFWRPDHRAERYRQLLQAYCELVGVSFIDTKDKLNEIGLDAYSVKGPHLSPVGYMSVSDEIVSSRLIH